MSRLHLGPNDLLVTGIGQLVTAGGDRAGGAEAALAPVSEAAVAVVDGRVAFAGPARNLPPLASRDGSFYSPGGVPAPAGGFGPRLPGGLGDTLEVASPAEPPEAAGRGPFQWLDAGGGLVTPGFVDPHTHLVFAGDRTAEFAERCAGVPYLDILARGGGILATVRATREADEETLAALASARLWTLARQGVTTVEIKSGYGLTVADELKMLRAARRAAEGTPVRVVTSLLGAHAVPPEYADRRDDYVTLVCEEMIPAAAEAGLARHVDAFVESGAFTPDDARRLARAARDHGLGLRLHVDQMNPLGGAELAAELGATSADHLEQISPAGIAALAESDTVAGLLPTATLYARLTQWAPGRALADAGVVLSLATNWNPGSANTGNHALALGLACLWNGLTPAEAVLAATDGAARSLGLTGEVGRLVPGARGDLVLHATSDYRHLPYHLAVDHVVAVAAGGRLVFDRALDPGC